MVTVDIIYERITCLCMRELKIVTTIKWVQMLLQDVNEDITGTIEWLRQTESLNCKDM